jgi:hypothetical protein
MNVREKTMIRIMIRQNPDIRFIAQKAFQRRRRIARRDRNFDLRILFPKCGQNLDDKERQHRRHPEVSGPIVRCGA